MAWCRRTVAEIGCGAGGILAALHRKLPGTTVFKGYEIAPAAFERAKAKEGERLCYYNQDLLSDDSSFDLLLVIDVLEHIPNYYAFAEGCRSKAKYKIYHIPLEISVQSVLRASFAFTLDSGRNGVGHLHFFTAESALMALKETGHRILDVAYTAGGVELAALHPSFKRRIANIPRRMVAAVSLPGLHACSADFLSGALRMKLGAFETTGRGPEAGALRACVMTIQQGARRNYVYTNQLEEAGLLHSAVTDVSWAEDGFGMTAQLLRWIAPQLRRAVARRTVRNIPPGKLKASLLPNIVSAALPFLHQERRFVIVDAALAFRCRLRGLGGARVVVNYHGNGGSFLDYAKARGAKIATDFVITPDHLEIEQAERERWPGWEAGGTPKHILAFYRRRMAWLLQISDLYLCPSQTVVNGLSRIPGFDAARVRLVPYGISGVLLKKPQPVTGRVLFAGAARPAQRAALSGRSRVDPEAAAPRN